jgi:hypothetical protein
VNRKQAVQQLEDFARYLMGQLPSEDWRDFAHDASFRVMRLSQQRTSESGRYHVEKPKFPEDADTEPPPQPEKKA